MAEDKEKKEKKTTTKKKATTRKKTPEKKTTTQTKKKTSPKTTPKEEVKELVVEEPKKEKKELIAMIICISIIIVVLAIVLIISESQPKEVERVLTRQTPEQVRFKNDKLNVYFFYGDGCPHCEDLIEFLNNLPEKYDHYFDLYTFEVWYDQSNNNLLDKLLAELDAPNGGLPCLFVGDQVFYGYTDEIGQKIKKAIKEEYLLSEKYDVYKEYKEA